MAEEKKEDIITEIYKSSEDKFYRTLIPITILTGPMYKNLLNIGQLVNCVLGSILSAYKKLNPVLRDIDMKNAIRLNNFSKQIINYQKPTSAIMIFYYITFNETINHIVYANLINDPNFYHNPVFISAIPQWKKTFSNLIMLQKMCDKILVSKHLVFVYYDKPVDQSDVKWNCLLKSKFDEFLDNVKKKI
jgi:hypothetical protein